MILGDRSPLGFALLLSLRSHLGRGRGLTIFTALAIALSVALASGLEMSARSVQAALESTADALAGRARLQVSAGGVGVREELLETIAAVQGVEVASPVLSTRLNVELPGARRRALQLLGVDLLADGGVRGYRLEASDVAVDDPLRLISQLDSIVITRAFARDSALRLGDTLRATSTAGDLELVVRGILEPGGIADAYEGQIAAMDVYALQEHLGRAGWLDRIDVVPAPGADLARLRAAIEHRVKGVAQVRQPDSRGEFAEQVFGTIRLGAAAMATIGVLVAVFLSYGTTSLSVDARTREFALLQAAGLEPRRVRQLVHVDVAVVASAGTALGIGLGAWTAQPLFELFAGLSEHLDAGRATQVQLTGSTLVTGFAVGLVVSAISSLEPAARASSRPPLEVLASARRIRRGSTSRRGAWVLAAMLAAGSALPLPAACRVLALFAGGLGLVAAATRPVTLPLLERAGVALQSLAPALGSLLGSGLRARPFQLGLTLAAIAGIVAGLSAILILLSSVERSFGAWVGGRYADGIIVTAGDPFDRALRDSLSPATVRAVRNAAGDDDVLENVHTAVLHDGAEVILFGRTMSVLRERGRLTTLDRPWPEVADALRAGGIAISDAFQRRTGRRPGEVLELDTPTGTARLPIAAVVRDYYGTAGALHVDIETFDRHWPRSGAASMVIWPRGDAAAAVDGIRRAVGDQQPLFFTHSAEYARWMEHFFERFVSLLWIVAAFTLLLGSLAIVTLLTGSVLGRERELTQLRVAGATRGLLVGLVLTDGLWVAGAGSLAGLGLGWLCSFPLIDLLAEWMGWSVERSVRWMPLLGVAGVAVMAALLACAHPAWLARRVRPALAGLAD